jgi:hypothetical protein
MSRRSILYFVVGISLVALLIPGRAASQEEKAQESSVTPPPILEMLSGLIPSQGTLSDQAQQQADRTLKEASELCEEVSDLQEEVLDLRDDVWEGFSKEMKRSSSDAVDELSKLMDKVVALEKNVVDLGDKASGLMVQVQEVNWRGYKLAKRIEKYQKSAPGKESSLVARTSLLAEDIIGVKDMISDNIKRVKDVQDEFSSAVKKKGDKKKSAIKQVGDRIDNLTKEVSILTGILGGLRDEAEALVGKIKSATTMEREEAEEELIDLAEAMRKLAYAAEKLSGVEGVEDLNRLINELTQVITNVGADLGEEVAEKIGVAEVEEPVEIEEIAKAIKDITKRLEEMAEEKGIDVEDVEEMAEEKGIDVEDVEELEELGEE